MEKIIVLDFGSQYTHLLARRIRQLNVYSEIVPADINAEKINGNEIKGIILSGGPRSVDEKNAPDCDSQIFNLGLPVLGLCYGHHLIAKHLGGQVTPGKTKEYGLAQLKVINKNSLFKNLDDSETVWMSHGDRVEKLPDGFITIGSTNDCPISAMANEEKKIFGLQFHPEVTDTVHGMKILKNFVDICGCKKNWKIKDFIEEQIKEIKNLVGSKKVFLLISGGVDSTVCFVLLNKALGKEKVYGLFVDNGFIRKNEAGLVKESLEKIGLDNFHIANAEDKFLKAVENIYDPEKKREIIGETFLKVKEEEIEKLNLNPDEWILGQGTIYPDTIETGGTKEADKIKTHHNRVEAVQKLIKQGKVIEPLKELYKDEVRKVGLELGLPKDLVYRHPFPGPGLAVRCLCLKQKEEIKNLAEIKKQLAEILKNTEYRGKILPLKSVGVQGDFRTYKHPVVLIGPADWNKLEELSTKITNNIKELNRVLYLLKPGKLEEINIKENSYLTKKRLDTLRESDYIAMKALAENNLMQKVWQMPTVLIPLGKKEESIVLRPIESENVMTVRFSKLPWNVVRQTAGDISNLEAIDYIFFDITHKPPGTVEWE